MVVDSVDDAAVNRADPIGVEVAPGRDNTQLETKFRQRSTQRRFVQVAVG